MDLRLSRVVTAKTVVFASLLCVSVPVSSVASQSARRLRSNIEDTHTFVLQGNTRPAISSGIAQDLGPVSPLQVMPRMSFSFSLTAAQQTDLAQLLSGQQNRRSAHYRKFLTPEDYADRFGLNTADIANVTTWLENSGFSNIQAARSRNSVSFSGTAAQAQAAFHVGIHSYTLNGEMHVGNTSDPELPKALQGVVQSISGLHNFAPKPINPPAAVSAELLKPHYTTSGGTHYLAPDDWETIYDVKPLYSAGLTGAPLGGQTYSIIIVGQSDVASGDISAFRAAAGLSVNNPATMVVPGDTDPGLQSATGDQSISTLDLEWAGAIAPNANILFLIGGINQVQDAIKYAIDNNLAPVLSTSYGECESSIPAAQLNSQNALLQQAAAQGITVVASTGNSGAAACDTTSPAKNGLAVLFPASSQYVTAVGGTEFSAGNGSYFGSSNNANGGSATSYIPEVAWNDGNLAATGGGASTVIAKPSWQTGTGVPSDGQRDTPDLAFAASIQNEGLLYCFNGSCTNGFLNASSTPVITGGTAAGSSAFSGVVALLVQKTGSRVGLLNPNLYSLAAISSNAFHDITGGNNQVNCAGGTTGCPATGASTTGSYGYSAGVGYDLVTGWGSIDSNNFVEQWSGDINISASPATVNVSTGNSVTSTVTVSPVNNFTGVVSFSCSVAASISTNISCSVPGNTVTTSGQTTVTITAGNLAHNFPPRAPTPKTPAIPPSSLAWLAVIFGLSSTAYAAPKFRFFTCRSSYIWSAAALLVLAMGAVSCGSGSAASVLSLTCTLPEPIVGVAYNGGTCVASSGATPYTYSVEAIGSGGIGPLPPGLNLSATTGAVSGTPTTAGIYPFIVEVTDSASKTASEQLNLTVQPAQVRSGYVTVTAQSGAIVNSTNILVTTSF